MKRGFSLMELLVVIGITLVVGAGVYIAYVSLIREAVTKSIVAKNEQDINSLVYQLRKDLFAIGFGVDKYRLVLRNDGIVNCNSLGTFANMNTVIARCRANDRQEELYYLSLTARQFLRSGCWWSVDGSGNLTSNSMNYMLANCPNRIDSSMGSCLVIDLSKSIRQFGPCPDFSDGFNNNFANTLIFFAGNSGTSYPGGFSVRYYTSGTNLPRECAPQTFNLLKDVSGDATAQPVFSCLGAFRVRYFDGTTYRESLGNINNLRAIRVCLLVQIGGITSLNLDVPSFSDECGGAFTLPTNEWRRYRWKVVEENIALENLR